MDSRDRSDCGPDGSLVRLVPNAATVGFGPSRRQEERQDMTTSSMRLLRAGEIIRMPVVTIDGGEDVAEVKDVVYDDANHQLVGFTLNKRGWFRGTLSDVLDATQIAAVGDDAVMVDSDTDVSAPVAAADAAALGGGGDDVLGDSVITTDGTVLGTVSGVIVSAGQRPAAVGYEVPTMMVPRWSSRSRRSWHCPATTLWSRPS